MKATSIGGKGDTRKVAVSVGVVLLSLRVLVVAALLICAAHAQTLVTQPTTLWVGSQDTTLPLNFIERDPGNMQFQRQSDHRNLGTVNSPLRSPLRISMWVPLLEHLHHGLGNVRLARIPIRRITPLM